MLSIYDPKASGAPLSWSWVVLSGPDAQDFLHRLTTVNVRALETGQGAPGCFLNPQGKIRSYFRLWRFGDGDYAFEFDAGAGGRWKQELLATIDQYTFAEKLAVTDVTELECLWLFGEAAGVPAPDRTAALDREIRICHQGSLDYGRPWITAWGRPGRLSQWAEREVGPTQPVSFEQLEQWRVEALRPRVDREITDASNPLEIGIPDAVAVNKGCYPGQEVLEKISALGAPARRLARIEGQGQAPRPGDKILNEAEPPTEVGQVTSVAPGPGGFSALAIIRKIHAKEGLSVKLSQGGHASITRVAPYV